MSNFGNKNSAARYVHQIILSEKLTHNPTIQLIDSLVRARIAKIFLESNPSLKIFRGSERIKSVAMVRQCSRRAYRCALENFTSCGKFWKICKILGAAIGQPLGPPAAIRVIFARPDPMVRKVAFFYNVAFCDLSYNKNRNRAGKFWERRTIISSFLF